MEQYYRMWFDLSSILLPKIASIQAVLNNSEYEKHVAKEVRDAFSVYGFCFNLAVMMNHKLAEGEYSGKIPFILDEGNPYAEAVRKAHLNMRRIQNEGLFLHVGGLYFDDDKSFGILQAADVVAWGARRYASGKAFPPGLEPILEIFKHGHNQESYKAEWLKMIGDNALRRAEMRIKKANEEEF